MSPKHPLVGGVYFAFTKLFGCNLRGNVDLLSRKYSKNVFLENAFLHKICRSFHTLRILLQDSYLWRSFLAKQINVTNSASVWNVMFVVRTDVESCVHTLATKSCALGDIQLLSRLRSAQLIEWQFSSKLVIRKFRNNKQDCWHVSTVSVRVKMPRYRVPYFV